LRRALRRNGGRQNQLEGRLEFSLIEERLWCHRDDPSSAAV
jgi:hypothetical protein